MDAPNDARHDLDPGVDTSAALGSLANMELLRLFWMALHSLFGTMELDPAVCELDLASHALSTATLDHCLGTF
jgi:hypothetical protein